MKISFFTAFWSNDNLERLRNINFTKEKIEDLCDYLFDNGVDCDFTIFDFSEKKQINESIHIPYDKNSYDRSKKVNMCMKYLIDKENPEIICQFDSDIFLEKKHYKSFHNLIKNLNNTDFYIASVFDISEMSLPIIDFENMEIDLTKVVYSVRNITGLGAVFLTNTSNLTNVGGFDERFKVWGGEDDDLADRLMKTGKNRKFFPFNFYHLPHTSLGKNIEKNPDYIEQVRIWKTDTSVIRPSYLNNYHI